MRTPVLLLLTLALFALAGCKRASGPKHRERAAEHDKECASPSLRDAYFYPAENRTDYGPDDPKKDGCELLVPDHLFCCPKR